jgi:putative membrane protein
MPIRRLSVLLLSIYLFVYPWSVPMLMFDLVPEWGTWMGGFLVIVQGSVIALWLAERYRARGVLAAAAIALLSFAVEYLGVTTGVPFGRYMYTDQLGVKIGAVPLPIPFAWLVAVPGAIAVAHVLGVRGWMRVFVAALLAVVFDIAIEPFATHIAGYWQWLDGGPYYDVPLANFAAWGATALVLAAITLALCTHWIPTPTRPVELPAVLFVLNLVQFVCVDVAYGYYGAAVIGVPVVLVCSLRMLTAWSTHSQRWGSLLER